MSRQQTGIKGDHPEWAFFEAVSCPYCGFSFRAKHDRPISWCVEAGYTFETSEKEVSLAIAYQGTENCLMLELPERRILGSVGVAFNDHLALAFEYAYDEDYSEADGGTGKDAKAGTLQLALSF